MLKLSLPLRLVLSAVLNAVLVYILDTYWPQYVTVLGGLGAYVVIGSLLALMNFLVRPVMKLVTLPLHFFFALITDLIVNSAFLWLTYQITLQMDPTVAALTIGGGLSGWIIVSTIMGMANWLMKVIL